MTPFQKSFYAFYFSHFELFKNGMIRMSAVSALFKEAKAFLRSFSKKRIMFLRKFEDDLRKKL